MSKKKDWIHDLYVREFLKPKHHPDHFYWENGKMVMTEKYHLARGKCCGSGCKHCPWRKKN